MSGDGQKDTGNVGQTNEWDEQSWWLYELWTIKLRWASNGWIALDVFHCVWLRALVSVIGLMWMNSPASCCWIARAVMGEWGETASAPIVVVVDSVGVAPTKTSATHSAAWCWRCASHVMMTPSCCFRTVRFLRKWLERFPLEWLWLSRIFRSFFKGKQNFSFFSAICKSWDFSFRLWIAPGRDLANFPASLLLSFSSDELRKFRYVQMSSRYDADCYKHI
jgi:hypothetical protein